MSSLVAGLLKNGRLSFDPPGDLLRFSGRGPRTLAACLASERLVLRFCRFTNEQDSRP